jgi:polyhydroxyalkanoate synthase
MSNPGVAWETGEAAAETLAPEFNLVAELDSGDFGKSLAAVMRRAARRHGAVLAANLRFAGRLATIGPAAVGRWFGSTSPPPVPVEKDRRFLDPAWEDHPGFFALRQSYVAARGLAEDLLTAGRGWPGG